MLFGYHDHSMSEHQVGVRIDFIKSQELGFYSQSFDFKIHQRLIDEAAVRQLEIARRDFLALFEMHREGLQGGLSKEEETSSKSREKLLWKAPAVEISHLLVDGKRDSNDWAWPHVPPL